MAAPSPLLYFGIVGLLFANHVTSSCVTEENLSKGMKETSCVNLALTSVPMTDIPQDTGILILSFNNLKAISTSTFKGMKQLVELDLSDNDLTSFNVDLPIMLQELILANNSLKSIPDLSQMSSLTKLVLSNNRISSIPDSAFKGLVNLKVLELQKNAIDFLSGEVFNGLEKLEHLDLSSNNLWELPTNLISKLKRLEKFYLAENKLTKIPDDFFVGLDSFAYVYLNKNPWICNCALKYLKEWVEENAHYIYYLFDGTPVSDEKSVLCSDGNPVIDFDTDACVTNGHGDVDHYLIPTKYLPANKITKAQPTTAETTKLWMTTMETTTESLPNATLVPTPTTTAAWTTRKVTTKEYPTTVAPTNKSRRLTTPIVTSTEQPETTPTTASWTTRKVTTEEHPTTVAPTKKSRRLTTPIVTSTEQPETTPTTAAGTTRKVTTEEYPTTVAPTKKSRRLTTSIVTSTKQPETTPTTAAWTTPKISTTTYRTTIITTTEQRRTTRQEVTSIVYSATTLNPMVKVEPSTLSTTVTSTPPLNVSNVPTSVKLTETSFMPTEILPPAVYSRAAAHGMSWLEYIILQNCCFLHLVIYILSILLLMVQMILSACLLVWTHTHLYMHYRALMEKLPNIRLIRYSLRAPVSEGEVLLVHDKAIESTFNDQSTFGVTRMLVLEANTREQQRIYTSAIL